MLSDGVAPVTMSPMRALVLASIVLALASSTSAAPANRAECEAAGGQLGRFGLRPQEQCDLPTPDAGKACADSRECASACIAPDAASPGSRAEGTCFGRTLLQGACRKHVRDGVVTPPMCAD